MRHFLLVFVIVIVSFCAKDLSSQTADYKSFEVVFLTDVHIPDKSHAIRGYEQAVKEINQLNPDFVINGGDMIMDALKVPLDTALRLVHIFDSISDKIKMPVYKTMGNHDIYGIYFGDSLRDHPAYGKQFYERYFGEKCYTFDYENWRFFFLDGITITPENSYIGAVDSIQLNWIKSVLDTTSREKQLAIISHIPFYSIGYQVWKGSQEAAPAHGLVANSNEVVQLFDSYNLKLILQGHLHIFEKLFINDRWIITGGAVSSRWWTGKNNGLEEGFTRISFHPDGHIDANYHVIDWEVVPSQD